VEISGTFNEVERMYQTRLTQYGAEAAPTTGTLVVDDDGLYAEMKRWSPADISKQIAKMISSVSPDGANVADFEVAVRELFPR
jgi:predicted regulator of Ras-like GTPase activity (Roadblock/LC7/MglB family)